MPPRSTVPIPGITHGLGPTGKPSGYAQGCGCPPCRDAKAAYMRERKAARTGTAVKPPAAALGADETRNASIVVRFTAAEKALIDRLAAQDGIPATQWIRDPALAIAAERAGYEDTVPERPWQVRRESASSTRTGDGGDARDINVRVPFTRPERALIEKLAAEDGMPVMQWLREPVLDLLEDRAGYEDTARRKAPRRASRSGQESQ